MGGGGRWRYATAGLNSNTWCVFPSVDSKRIVHHQLSRPSPPFCENNVKRHKVVREALHCPLCKVIIAPFPGEDPNVAMSQHIDSGCNNPDEWKKGSRFDCSMKKCT